MKFRPSHHLDVIHPRYIPVQGQARPIYDAFTPWIITNIDPYNAKPATRLRTGSHIHIRDFERYQEGGQAVEQRGTLLGIVGWERGYVIFFLKFTTASVKRDLFGSHLLGVTVAIPRSLVHLGLRNALRYRHYLPTLGCTLGQTVVGDTVQPPYRPAQRLAGWVETIQGDFGENERKTEAPQEFSALRLSITSKESST
jgi:hypothetical protein